MIVTIYNSQKKLKISKRAVIDQVKALMDFHNVTPDEIIFHFVGKTKIKKLHKQFFNDPTPTDCITFPMDRQKKDSYFILGEVFVCPEVAMDYAKKHNLNPYDELALYIIHGILHLLGYNDLNPSERKVMKKKEKECMKFLRDKHIL